MTKRALVILLVLLSSPAIAQEEDGPDAARWRPLVERGRVALEAGRFAEAGALLEEADDYLASWDGTHFLEFACDRAVAAIGAGEPAPHLIADAVAPDAPGGCDARLGDAYTHAGRPEQAALHYLRARAAGVDVRERYDALPAPIRTRAELYFARLGAEPLVRVIEPAASPDELAQNIARAVGDARPTRVPSCSPEREGWGGRARGVITCSYADAPMPRSFGFRYPLESFVWERARGRVRAVASFASGTGYDCEAGHQDPVRSMTALTMAEHGADGWLLHDRDVWMYDGGEGAVLSAREYVYACTRASGACARVEQTVEQCVQPRRGPRRCSTRYLGEASVRRGVLTIRIDEGELPVALQTPLVLASLQPSPPSSSSARSGAVPMRGCRVTVHDDRPPLNVRARPSARAPIVGTLAEGTVVVPDRTREGAWVPLRAPLRGWVWATNLRRVCANSTAPDDAPPR